MSRPLAVFALLFSSSLFAAGPVAVITGGTDIKVNKRPLQTAGAPNWPVAVGDEIVTGTSAVLTFPDGARVTLGADTRVVIQQCDRCVVQLFRGTTQFVKPAGSKFEMCALGHPVRPSEGTEGSVTVEGKDKVVVRVAGTEQVVTSGTCSCDAGAAWLHAPSHVKTVVLVGAGAAATGTTVALTRGKRASAQ